MGLIGTIIQCLVGTIAGALRLGPILLGELLFSKKKIAPYDPSMKELGAAAALQSDHEFINFKDVYITSKDGRTLHAVIDDGQGRKKGMRPIVFVHGFPDMWISWIDQIKHFAAKGHPILALSMRGYGLSDKPNPSSLEPYHLFDSIIPDIRAAVLYAAKDAAAEEGKSNDLAPLLVAHDWGAALCWAYVTQGQTTKQKEVSGYATLAVPPPACFKANIGLKQFWASLYMFFFNMPWLPETIMLANNAWFIGRLVNTTKRAILPDWMTNMYRINCLQNGAMTAQLNYYRSMFQTRPKPNNEDVLGPKNDGNTKARLLDLPVLIIRGKDDEYMTKDVFVGYDRYLSNARLVALDDCSHWIQADQPAAVNIELEKLLSELT